MSDREAFDARLGAALRQYAARAPVDVDSHAFARGIAALAGRGQRAAGLSVLRSTPALAWVLLAAALLVAAAVGVMVGGRIFRDDNLTVVPEPTAITTAPTAVALASACPPGTSPNEPGPVDQARPPAGHVVRGAFDRDAGKVVIVAQGWAEASLETWTFDVCTNTWARMEPRQDPDLGQWISFTQLVHDSDSDATVAVGEDGSVWTYDLHMNIWTEKDAAPATGSEQGALRLVYDPGSGLMFAQANLISPPLLWTYDVETDTWAEVRQQDPPFIAGSGDHELLAWDTSAGRIVAYHQAIGWWLFDPRAGAWTKGQTSAPEVNTGYIASGGEIAYDEATKQTVVFSDGLVIAYDDASKRWETLYEAADDGGNGPTHRVEHLMVYDPLNERIVVYGGAARTAEGPVTPDDVLAFDPATRTWTQLLAPSTPYAQGTN